MTYLSYGTYLNDRRIRPCDSGVWQGIELERSNNAAHR